MVRINVGVNPVDLTDEHLKAENVEIIMLFRFIEKHPFGDVPEKFSLNKGHMSFFRNKAGYLIKRSKLVQTEMRKRGMNVKKDYDKFDFKILSDNYKDYSEKEEDTILIKERILERIINPKKKRTPHNWYGNNINKEFLKKYEK